MHSVLRSSALRGSIRSRLSRLSTLLLAGTLMTAAACDDSTPADPITVATVEVSPRLNTARVGTSQQLTAVAKDASGNAMSGETFTWTTSEPTVATVSASGLVTYVGAGSTAIIASARGTTGFATIVSDANVSSVQMGLATATVGPNSTLQLTANGADAAGNALFRPVTWTSSVPTVATVSSTGLVTAVAQSGTTTITATVEGKTGTTVITVAPPPVATVTVAPATGYLPTLVGVPLSTVLRDGVSNVLTGRTVTWSTSNAALATVSGTGVATGVATGSVTITATSEGKSGTATYSVRNGLVNATPITFSNTTTAFAEYAVYVPAGTTSLKVTLASGTGDPDLYLYRPGNTGTPAGGTADDCHSFNDGPGETCTVANPVAGVWHIMIDPFAAHVGTIITATLTPAPAAAIRK